MMPAKQSKDSITKEFLAEARFKLKQREHAITAEETKEGTAETTETTETTEISTTEEKEVQVQAASASIARRQVTGK
jgi:hypothetical protein